MRLDATIQPRSPDRTAPLVARLLPAVERIARSLRRRYPRADIAELAQVGALGLVESLRAHHRDERAEAHAIIRIRGAMLDFLRREDPLTRGERRAVRQFEAVQWARAAESTVQVNWDSFATPAGAAQRFDGRVDRVRAPTPDPCIALECRQVAAALAAAIGRLDDRLRNVIMGHYVDDVAFQDLGRRLGVSKSRVSQLHKRALEALRAELGRSPG